VLPFQPPCRCVAARRRVHMVVFRDQCERLREGVMIMAGEAHAGGMGRGRQGEACLWKSLPAPAHQAAEASAVNVRL